MEIKSGLKAISELIGEYNREAIHAIYGASQVGKTTLGMQLLYEASEMLQQDVLFYDTEGGAKEFIKLWDGVLRKRYPKAKEIHVRMYRNWKDILKDHGKTATPRTSDTGKMDVLVTEEKDPSPLEDFIVKKKIGMILYDSITMPMKTFGSARQNFPARNYAQTLWLSSMIDIIDRHNCIIFASHHASKDPALPYAAEEMTGGSAVQYFSKILFYMKKWRAKGATAYRTIKLQRYFNKAPNEFEMLLKITANGYID
ncbi:MAG: hypothetical protein ACREAK_10335, partial [Nitrosarchaeum sp.]